MGKHQPQPHETMVEHQNAKPTGKETECSEAPNSQNRNTGVKSTLLPTPKKNSRRRSTNEISPLKDPEGHLITEVAEKVTLLFKGTSIILTNADLGDIPTSLPTPDSVPFPTVTKHEIAKDAIMPHLTIIFNACFETHHFPPQWKEALMTIIRKTGKEDYTDPNAYWPIALLNTLGKVFEKIINDRLIYWAKQTNTLHPGHVGGRPGQSIKEAFTMLSTWIHQKWWEKKVVLGLFLDVKSAYPTVYKERLVHSLWIKSCPIYLYLIIESFLTDRTTRLRLNQYISQAFPIPNGLPLGSPLSVTLYLLLPAHPSLDSDSISIAYVNDVTHLVAKPSADQGMKSLATVFQHSENWRRRHSAIFDPKKAKVIAFTKRKMTYPLIQLENQLLSFEKKVRWLGIILTPTLTPGAHLKTLKKHFNHTIAQLARISRLTFGLNQKRVKTTNISSSTHSDSTWQHIVVHNEEQKQSQQAS
ncbi:hypothetical protein O181_040661 [Austropuccinia psidii MF-1]|uniref:Reverse transcriptase domain-containing protein n=1 Tax=Austropuccinia psidii MF-1 TaxID=1389203 RepID=A0A9Q3DI95_9BASI|nr:hypothetical protein [Austropuccinia psidii MF-1]